ncbi:MAG: hypothetical protein IPG52_15710, partial [Rhodocyclaceae bacterium]|nr:hypothetical protein [Rhodocyclaceae bacterium]
MQAMVRVQRELTRKFFPHRNEKMLITFSRRVAEPDRLNPRRWRQARRPGHVLWPSAPARTAWWRPEGFGKLAAQAWLRPSA